jgi:hypothetical protein
MMENLTLEDPLQQGGAQSQMQNQMPLGGGVPPPNQQLPPQMFTTAAQLLDMTDSKDCLYSATPEYPRKAVQIEGGEEADNGRHGEAFGRVMLTRNFPLW